MDEKERDKLRKSIAKIESFLASKHKFNAPLPNTRFNYKRTKEHLETRNNEIFLGNLPPKEIAKFEYINSLRIGITPRTRDWKELADSGYKPVFCHKDDIDVAIQSVKQSASNKISASIENKAKLKHAELQEGEIYYGNIYNDELHKFKNYSFKSKRLGSVAYTISGKVILDAKPIFVLKSELEAHYEASLMVENTLDSLE